MELQFIFSEGYTVNIPVVEDVWEAGDFNPIREAVLRLPDLYPQFNLVVPVHLEYGVLQYELNRNGFFAPPGQPTVLLCFWADSITLRLSWNGEEMDSTNWYGYDGEPGNDGADNDEDAEDSDGGE